MRDPIRLDNFYSEMKEIHKKIFPDYRFAQLMLDFLGWIMGEKKKDPFFVEEDRLIEYLKEYSTVSNPFFKGRDLYPEEMKL